MDTNERRQLREALSRLTGEQIKTIAYELGIDFDDLPGQGEKIVDLIHACQHRDLIPHLWRTIQHIQTTPTTTPTPEPHFDCGHRRRVARTDIGLSVSAWVQALAITSERQLQRIESRADECPASLIERASALTAISPDWLTHGKGKKYPPRPIHIRPIDTYLTTLHSLKPDHLFFCLETSHFELILVVQTGDYAYHTFNFPFTLDFWNWHNDHEKSSGSTTSSTTPTQSMN